MEDKIKLLLRYIEKEKELNRQWDEEDGIDVNAEDYKINSLVTVDRVKNFIGYRNIRVEEAWFNKLNRGDNSREVREEAVEYDAKRSRRHSLALNSMIGLNEFGRKYDLPLFYDGELLKGEDIESYRNIDVRKKETDFFLQFIDKLSRTPGIVMQRYFDELGLSEEKIGEDKEFIKQLQNDVESVDNKYGVEKNLVEDDGDIKFKDDDILSGYER